MPALATRLCDTRDWVVSRSRHPEQIIAARLLRTELAPLHTVPSHSPDIDELDSCGEQLLVRHRGVLQGVGRLLPPGRSRLLHLESSFQLAGLAPIRDSIVELSGVGVRPEGSPALDMLLTAARQYAGDRRLLTAVAWQGDPAGLAPTSSHLVRPILPWPSGRACTGPPDATLRAYLRQGWQVCGSAAFDPLTGHAEVPLLWEEWSGDHPDR